MAEVAEVDQVQEQIPIQIELDAISVKSMITSQKIVQHQNYRRMQNKYSRCSIWVKSRYH